MKQILRSFLTLLMLVVWTSGFAADKTYSYTFVKGGVFTEAKQTKTLNGISWNFTAGGKTYQYDGNLKLADNVFPYILYIFIVRTRMSAR